MKRTYLMVSMLLLTTLLVYSQPPPPTPPSIPDVHHATLQWVDYDQDGDMDLFITGHTPGRNPLTQLLENNGTTLSSISTPFPQVYHGKGNWGDYDNDGLPDLILSGLGTDDKPVTVIYHNDGSGQFSAITHPLPHLFAGNVEWGDFNDDGSLDIFLNGYSKRELYQTQVYLGDGYGQFSIKTRLDSLLTPAGSWTDIDMDGDLDILLMGRDLADSLQLKILQNDSSLGMTSLSGPFPFQAGFSSWADYNLDGYPDLLLSGVSQNGESCRLYTNTGGSLTLVNSTLRGGGRGGTFWADYDLDGDLDFLSIGNDALGPHTTLYRNDGGGAFTSQTTILPALQDAFAAWGDFDGDGYPDLVLSGLDSSGEPVATFYWNISGSFN